MYILIDMENMVVRHKHPDHSTVSSLAKIELSHTVAKVIPIGTNTIHDLTEMEIRLLHSHVTGQKIVAAQLYTVREELRKALEALPDSDVNMFEVKQQALKIPLHDQGFYRYVKGSYTAQKVPALFLPTPIDTSTPAHVAPVVPVVVPQEAPKTAAQPVQPVGVLPSWHPAYKRG